MLSKSSNIIEKEFENLRKELLDLTLRNQLLNFKSRARTITIVNQSPINLYQTLVLQENKMYFVANKKDKKSDKSNSVWDHISFDFSKFTEGDKKLATDLTPKELQKRLYYINNQAKTMLQEQGYNILYLAIGFLEWVDKTKPKQVNKAPLVLIPVSIERKKVGESFNLEWTGEDIQTNISLKAKLLEAGIEIPDFEFKKYGEVVDHYIAKIKHATDRMPNWKVNNDVALGFFSFTKFVMYNDLNPEAWPGNVDLTKNELIQAIFNPSKNTQEAFREEDIDSRLEYANMYQVLDADSSQIAAIEDVKAGRNLVVEGPPGTGKSQTIVNLIAELLAEGKSVLFVSEKMAALDVVKDRLTGVGLGKFILELHSHKTRRKKFLKDLEKATNVRSQEPLNIDQTIRKLETLRRQLDDYSQIIHKPSFSVNLSPFQLYGMKEGADDHFSRKGSIMPLVRFSNPENVTLKDLDDLTLSLENLAELHQTISKENPWSKCAPKSLLPADLREIEMLINDTLLSLDNFLVERGRVYDTYGIKKPDTLNEFQNSLSAFEIIKSQSAELIDGNILKSGAWDNNNNDAFKLISQLEQYQKNSVILNKFNNSIYHVDIDKLINQLRQLYNKKFRFFNNKQHIELVERFYRANIPGSIEDIINDLNEVKDVIKLRKDLETNNSLGKSYYGVYWHVGANINDLKAIANWMSEFKALVHERTFSQNTIDILSKDLYDIKPERDLAEYIDSGEEFVKVLSNLKSKLNPRSKLIFKRETGDVAFEDWREQLYNWRGQLSSLHLWSQYLNTKNALKGSYAEMFIESIEKRNVKKDDVKALVEGNFADSLLNILFVENQELATFIGELHENRIDEFKDLDKKILLLNRKRIFYKLNSSIPQIFGHTENPQVKILAGEFTRKSGHMPVRKLLEKAGGLIKQIKPCFMMSPLSVAQYLDPTNEELQFDVVIFDEASQVKPEDALGAFMRGKTAVVMGDTQQLPPTSFFDQMSTGESEEEVATSLDMESILHLCKLSFPVKMLKWHYRSRHESLISVSNKEFYDNDLLVYPSPSHNDPELGLKFIYNPNTAYDRGSSSANLLEAKDVVDEIFNHFDKFGDTKSLGVGTFSVAQKNAILEELELRRKERPELEPLFSDNKDEHFFVKNLETIQGDERDVILISIGYGFDNDRKMSLNFGPLNQDGGERRLNVLITRAREKCVVFSNFKAYDMHLTANPPFGVKALKEFLSYAENLTLGTEIKEQQTKEPFEDAIYNFLVENDYQVDKQIGCAGFRVDLAIVDEENPGKYILGITTDGKMYSSSKVARDRDRLREQVLTGLGWKLYHLWSTDWYRNRDLCRKKLLDFVERTIKDYRAEEKRKSEEAKKLAEERQREAEKKAEELRLARERELAEEKQKEENEESFDMPENIGPEDFVEVEYDNNTSNLNFNDNSKGSIDDNFVDAETPINDLDFEVIKPDAQKDDSFEEKEVWELEDDNDDFNDNAEIWEDTNENTPDENSNSTKDGIKSHLKQKNDDNDKKTIFESLKFTKKLDDELEDNLVNDIVEDVINEVKDKSEKMDDSIDATEDVVFGSSVTMNNGEDKFPKSKPRKKKTKKTYKNKTNLKPNNAKNDSYKNTKDDRVDLGSDEDYVYVDHGDGEDRVDLGSDEDYVYVDHGDDETNENDNSSKDNNLSELKEVKAKPIKEKIIEKGRNSRSKIMDSLSEAIRADPQLKPEEIKIVKGEYIDEGEPLHRPAPKDEFVVEAEFVGDNKNSVDEVLDDVFKSDNKNNTNKETMQDNDIQLKNSENNSESIVNEASSIENTQNINETNDKKVDESTSAKEIGYYEGVSDISNPLKKNNVYYEDHKDKSVKSSFKNLKKDIRYINDSLNEIQNPTPAEYVSVVDRTEEYDPNDYLTSEDENNQEEYINENEELTFAEREEKRYEDELMMEALKKEIADDENVIIPVHEEERRQNIKDQALENIIQNADEDYKEIEKERFQQNNKLKAFDDNKLPGKVKIEDKIIDYVEAIDFGLNSQKDIYEQPPSEVAKSINNIVDIEGPIHVKEVVKRVKDSCNIKRAGSNLKKAINSAIDEAENKGSIIRIGDFLYDASNNNVIVRKRDKPDIELISNEEIAKNIELLLIHKHNLSTKELAKEASRNFGFKSTSKKTANKINSVLDLMIADNKIKLEKDFVELK